MPMKLCLMVAVAHAAMDECGNECGGNTRRMSIGKITVINKCTEPVYFQDSMPANQKVDAGQQWSGAFDIKAGRISFAYQSFTAVKSDINNVWTEIATNKVQPGKTCCQGNLNFANQRGFIDMDLQVTAYKGSDLACTDGKARTALNVGECNALYADESAEMSTYEGGRQYCRSLMAGPDRATSDHSRAACTSMYANYINDKSLLWVPSGSSATDGSWTASARSTGIQDAGMHASHPWCPAKFADGYIAVPQHTGRVCMGRSVNFECFEDACQGANHHDADRITACNKVNGVTAGTTGWLMCGREPKVDITNLEIVTCPSQDELSSKNVKMPNCDNTGAPAPECDQTMKPTQFPNPQEWTIGTGYPRTVPPSANKRTPTGPTTTPTPDHDQQQSSGNGSGSGQMVDPVSESGNGGNGGSMSGNGLDPMYRGGQSDQSDDLKIDQYLGQSGDGEYTRYLRNLIV